MLSIYPRSTAPPTLVNAQPGMASPHRNLLKTSVPNALALVYTMEPVLVSCRETSGKLAHLALKKGDVGYLKSIVKVDGEVVI